MSVAVPRECIEGVGVKSGLCLADGLADVPGNGDGDGTI